MNDPYLNDMSLPYQGRQAKGKRSFGDPKQRRKKRQEFEYKHHVRLREDVVEIEEKKGILWALIEKKMGSIPVIVWKIIEILLELRESRLRPVKGSAAFANPEIGFFPGIASEAYLRMKRRRKLIRTLLQKRAGFHHLVGMTRISQRRFPLFLLSCQVPLNP